MSKNDEIIKALDDLREALAKLAAAGDFKYCLVIDKDDDNLVVTNMDSERLPQLLVDPIEVIRKDELQ